MTADQYAELLEAIKAAHTAYQHVDVVSLLGEQWQVGVSVRRVKV